MRRTLSPLLTAALLASGAGLAGADEHALAPERVRAIADSCAQCHGTDGRMEGAIPRIAGQSRERLEERLLGFRSGEHDATVMGTITRGYSEAELKALARYFAEIDD